MVSIYDTGGLEALRVRNAVQPHRMKLFLNALFNIAALENIIKTKYCSIKNCSRCKTNLGGIHLFTNTLLISLKNATALQKLDPPALAHP